MSLPLARLPSMDLVRGFVAVGRRMSITLAAEDLFLTQSAVSRQVQALEDFLGVQLLVRGHRSIAFTAEGALLFQVADGALRQMQDVVGELSVKERGVRPVTVSASVGVVGLWLLPRLGRFQQRHPGVDVRVSANDRVADLRNDGIDLAIRYAPPSAVPDDAIRLFGEAVAPVVHPSLRVAPSRTRQALARLPLLEFDHPASHPWLTWAGWLAARGWSTARPASVLHFNQYDLVIQAALAGQGVALGRLALVRPLVDAGQLVQLGPAHAASTTDHAYWLVGAGKRARDDVGRVVAWIVDEARRTAA